MSDDADDSITFQVNNKCHPDFVIFKIRKSEKLIKRLEHMQNGMELRTIYTLPHF